MEYKLNKIDTDIRKRIDEDRKSSKVHSGKFINPNNDFNQEKFNYIVNDSGNEKSKKKRFIIIDGIKFKKDKIMIQAEKSVKSNINNSVGGIIDIKK